MLGQQLLVCMLDNKLAEQSIDMNVTKGSKKGPKPLRTWPPSFVSQIS